MKDQRRYRFVRENERERIYWDRAEAKYVTTSRTVDLYADDDELISSDEILYSREGPGSRPPVSCCNTELRIYPNQNAPFKYYSRQYGKSKYIRSSSWCPHGRYYGIHCPQGCGEIINRGQNTVISC